MEEIKTYNNKHILNEHEVEIPKLGESGWKGTARIIQEENYYKVDIKKNKRSLTLLKLHRSIFTLKEAKHLMYKFLLDYAVDKESKFMQYLHHGKEVWVISEMKGNHQCHCLCWSCEKFNPNNVEENCPIAQINFEMDIENNITTPVWECAEFIENKK